MSRKNLLIERLVVAGIVLFLLCASFIAANHVDGPYQDQRQCLLCQFLQILSTFLAVMFALFLFRMESLPLVQPCAERLRSWGTIRSLVSRGPPISSC